jgi:hypothetical protein
MCWLGPFDFAWPADDLPAERAPGLVLILPAADTACGHFFHPDAPSFCGNPLLYFCKTVQDEVDLRVELQLIPQFDPQESLAIWRNAADERISALIIYLSII